MKERVDTFQVGPVNTKAEALQLALDKMPAVIAEVEKSGNGKTATASAKLERFENLDGMSPAFVAHIYIEHLGLPVTGYDLQLVETRTIEEWLIGTAPTPELDA